MREGFFPDEKVKFNLARLKKGGELFEVVLDDPDLVIDFRHGKDIDIRDMVRLPEVFSDAKSGKHAKPEDMEKWLGTSDKIKAIEFILKNGDINLTEDHRKRLFEAKINKIISYIHMNAIDPKTGFPHPETRIKLAMKEAKVRVDPMTYVDRQIERIIRELRTILPISFEVMKLRVILPAKYAGHAYGMLKGKHTLSKDTWANDGSVSFELEGPVGIKADVMSLINKLTDGEATIEEVKE